MSLIGALGKANDYLLVYRPEGSDYLYAQMWYTAGLCVTTYKLGKFMHMEQLYYVKDTTPAQALEYFADTIRWCSDKWGRRVTYEELVDFKPIRLGS